MTAAEQGIETRDRIARRMNRKESVRTIAALAITHALRTDGTVTANDIRDQALAIHRDMDPHDIGAAFTGLRVAGAMVSMGYAELSTSDRAQGNSVRRWRLDMEKAARYLDRLQA